jgi:hypothetical protein
MRPLSGRHIVNKRDVSKKTIAILAEYGAAIIASQIIKNNVTATRIDKRVAVAVATFALGGVVAAAASKYIQRFIDDLFEDYDKHMKKIR